VLLNTTKGLIDDAQMYHERVAEETPCGKIVTDAWYLGGELVKQDVLVIANPLPIISGSISGGLLT